MAFPLPWYWPFPLFAHVDSVPEEEINLVVLNTSYEKDVRELDYSTRLDKFTFSSSLSVLC